MSTENNTANEKILDRIRKLLAMSKDTSSPNEAAIAARRARALMDAHQVAELDLMTIKNHDMGESVFETGLTQTNRPLGIMCVGIAALNDCVAGYIRRGRFIDIEFKGLLADSVCAVEMFKYLKAEMYAQAERHAEGRADRHAFRVGFASGVCQQVREVRKEREEIKTSGGQSLVVVKDALVRKHYGVQKTSTRRQGMSGGRDAYSAGQAAGRRANLGRQVQGATQRRLA